VAKGIGLSGEPNGDAPRHELVTANAEGSEEFGHE